jgi:hypothetical protein
VTGNKVPFSLKKAIHGPHVGVVYSRAAPAAAARAGALPNEEFTGSLAKVRLLLLFLKLPLSSSTALCGLRDIWGNHHHRAAGRHGAPGHRRRRQGRRAVRGRAQDTPTGFAIFDSIGRLRIVSFFFVSSGRAQKRSISTACVAIESRTRTTSCRSVPSCTPSVGSDPAGRGENELTLTAVGSTCGIKLPHVVARWRPGNQITAAEQ